MAAHQSGSKAYIGKSQDDREGKARGREENLRTDAVGSIRWKMKSRMGARTEDRGRGDARIAEWLVIPARKKSEEFYPIT